MTRGTQSDAVGRASIGNEAIDVGTERNCTAERSLLVCFSGKIGSGKTSVSTAVASALGCRWTSFSDCLRAQIEDRGGDPECRQALQDLGQGRIEEDAESFCREVLAAAGFVAGEEFVLDGVRHVDLLPHLTRIAAPSEVRLIFLDADAEVRNVRVAERSDRARRDFDRASRHVVEADMEVDLPSSADAIVDGSLSEADAVARCIALIQSWQSAGSSSTPAPKSQSDGIEARKM